MKELHLDFETRSEAELKKLGVTAYAMHPSTDAILVAWGTTIENVQVQQIMGVPDYRCPDDIRRGVEDPGCLFYAHNAAFEQAIWRYVMTPKYGWPECPPPRRWRCTMAMAYALALPGALDKVAEALRVSMRKDDAGYKLMLRMCKPQKRKKKGEVYLTWVEDAESRQRLGEYCAQDVRAEIDICGRLLPLLPEEQRLWSLDQRINARGVYVDVPLAQRALEVVGKAKRRLHAEMAAVTDGEVPKTDSVQALCGWLTRSLDWEIVESVKKDELAELLGRPLPGDIQLPHGRVEPGKVRQALDIRQEAAKASVAKIDALLAGLCADGRVRDLFQFHAASTGRWAGRRFQPQNLKRPGLKLKEILKLIELIREYGDPGPIEMYFGPALSAIGDVIRSLIISAPGRKLYSADFANIEGRGLAWEAGESRKLEIFRLNDTPLLGHNGGPRMDDYGDPVMMGPDPYLVAAAGIYRVPVETLNKKSPERQIGKVAELALGYQGGKGAFQAMASGYGVVVSDERADEIKVAWRELHPETKQFWRDAENAAFMAVLEPGRWFEARAIEFRKEGSFLFMRLPSGRCLAYPYPKIEPRLTWWGEMKDVVTFMGTDTKVGSPTKGKWTRLSTYGGKLVENATQAIARDVLRDAMFRLERNGYEVVMHVHDEVVAETDSAFGSLEEFEQIMAEVPPWAKGFPIKVEGWVGDRYRK